MEINPLSRTHVPHPHLSWSNSQSTASERMSRVPVTPNIRQEMRKLFRMFAENPKVLGFHRGTGMPRVDQFCSSTQRREIPASGCPLLRTDPSLNSRWEGRIRWKVRQSPDVSATLGKGAFYRQRSNPLLASVRR